MEEQIKEIEVLEAKKEEASNNKKEKMFKKIRKSKEIHPYSLIIVTFLSVILIGTILLLLDFAIQNMDQVFGSVKQFFVKLVDSLFTATSAVCVTGLTVVNISSELTRFGQIVMMVLMEVGGLSFITIAVFFFTIFGANIGVTNSFLLRESLNQNSTKGVVSLVRKIVLIALVIQLIGAGLNYIPLISYYDGNVNKAIFTSIFHTIASFNNAGFDIFGADSMVQFGANEYWLLDSITMGLIVLGSMGFVIIDDLLRHFSFKKLNLHSKITIIFTSFLIVAGTLLVKLTFSDLTWLQSLFTSITTRTAGFTLFDMSTLESHPATYLTIIVLMTIGASPCSTGGGVKTTTVAVILIAIFYYAKGGKIKIHQRTISRNQVSKAYALMCLVLMVILIGTGVICAIQPDLGFNKILFEVVSAFSTTGLSMGITTSLNIASRIVIILLMFMGRLGPLTVIGLLNKNWMDNKKENVEYIEGSVIIG